MKVADKPTSVAMSADGTRAFVTYASSPIVSIIDLSGPTPVVTYVTVPHTVDTVVASADGTQAYFISTYPYSADVISVNTGGV